MRDLDRALAKLAERAALEPLAHRARERTLDAALAGSVPPMPVRRRVAPAIGIAIAVAAAAAAVAIAVLATHDSGSRRGAAPSAQIALAPGTWTAVDHARVRLAAGGVAWRGGAGEIVLEAGRVEVEVDPTPHRPFRVVTTSFTVEVLGTVFAVDLDSVEVRHGAVRITSSKGSVLVERLAAGERWSPTTAARAPAPAPTPADRATTDAAEPGEPEIAMDALDVGTPPPPSVRPAGRSARERIAEARSLLAAGDPARARAVIQRALASNPPRAIRADAELLVAESYLRGGEVDTAITHFRGVADRYRDLATGEAALFAAARYEARAGHRDAARRLFETYIARYPKGSLVTQARVQLRGLGAP